MSESKVSFSDSTLIIDEQSLQLEYPILQVLLLKDKIIVLYDPDSCLDKKFGQFPNLIAFNFKGEKLWIAELPTNESQDCFYQVEWRNGLIADSWKSFSCLIDENNGRIRSKVFYK